MGDEETQSQNVALLPLHGEGRQLQEVVESFERGSKSTASVYFRRWGYICNSLKVAPGGIAAMSVKEARNFIHDLISSLKR